MQECDADGIDADHAAQLEQDARALAVLKTKISERTVCLICGGFRKKPTPKRTTQKFTYFGQRLSSDLCSFPTGIGDYKYAFCIVDAATNWLFVWLMKSKSSHASRFARKPEGLVSDAMN